MLDEHAQQDIDNAIGQLREIGADAKRLRKLKLFGKTGTLTIQSGTPATVFVDGERIGDTPVTRYPLSVGSHHIRGVTADGQTRDVDVDISANRESIGPRLF